METRLVAVDITGVVGKIKVEEFGRVVVDEVGKTIVDKTGVDGLICVGLDGVDWAVCVEVIRFGLIPTGLTDSPPKGTNEIVPSPVDFSDELIKLGEIGETV